MMNNQERLIGPYYYRLILLVIYFLKISYKFESYIQLQLPGFQTT